MWSAHEGSSQATIVATVRTTLSPRFRVPITTVIGCMLVWRPRGRTADFLHPELAGRPLEPTQDCVLGRGGQECGVCGTRERLPRPAKPARQREYAHEGERRCLRCPISDSRTRGSSAVGPWLRACLVCRAGFAGRGTAFARASDATLSRTPPTQDAVLGRLP